MDELLLGHGDIRCPRVNALDYSAALWRSIIILHVYRRHGSTTAFMKLNEVGSSRIHCWSQVEQLSVGFRLSSSVQLMMQLTSPRARCLPRSIAVCAAIRSLGIPAEVILGKKVVQQDAGPLAERFDFHAWCEVYGQVMTGDPSLCRSHVELLRFPRL